MSTKGIKFKKKPWKAKSMKPEDMKSAYTSMDWEDKMYLLKQSKEKRDRSQYLTLITWLDETPWRHGGCPISAIPEEVYWKDSE